MPKPNQMAVSRTGDILYQTGAVGSGGMGLYSFILNSETGGLPNSDGVVAVTSQFKKSQSVETFVLDTSEFNDVPTIEGFTSVIFQHEIDHLNGILYLDHLEKEFKN